MPGSGSPRAGLLVGVVVVALLLGSVPPVMGSSADVGFVYISTSIEPAQPTTAEEFNLTTSLTNAPESTETFVVRSIELADGTGSEAETYDSIEYSLPTRHTIDPGGTFSQALTLDFDAAGTRPVWVIAEVSTVGGGETFELTRRVNVTVYDPHPGMEATARPAGVGDRTAVSVTVANGFERPIRDLDLTLSSPTLTFREGTRVGSSVAGGDSRTFRFNATVGDLGTHPVQARLAYTDANGTRFQVTRTLQVAIDAPELNGRVNLAAEVATAIPGSETSLNLTVSNGLDRAIREFEVAIAGEGVTVRQPRRVDTGLESGETRVFPFRVSSETIGDHPVEVSLSYTTVDGLERAVDRTVQVTFAAPANPGNVTLTGLSFERSGDTLRVSGSASNVGDSVVSGVVIGVGSNDAVRPGSTESEFFVGTIGSSDFVSFDVNARLRTDASTVAVPLEISYSVEGVRLTRTVRLSYEGGGPTPTPESSGPPPLTIALGVLVVVVVLLLGVWGWRRGRD